MRWPWISRRLFEYQEREILELRRDRAELQRKYDDLMNQFIWRGTKIPLYPDKLPADYRESLIPKKDVVDPSAVLNDPKKEAEQPLSPRARLKQAEEAREKEFEEQQRKIQLVKEA